MTDRVDNRPADSRGRSLGVNRQGAGGQVESNLDTSGITACCIRKKA